MEQELKPEVKKILDNWYKNTEIKIIHYWEQDDTWFIIVRCLHKYPSDLLSRTNRVSKYNLDFVRIFGSCVLSGEYNISVDRTVGI